MGFIDDKKDIFNQIAALTSVKDEFNLPDQTSSLSSINNSKEIIPFFLDMLTVLVGSESLKSTVGDVMTGFLRSVEPRLRDSLKSQVIDFNSDEPLPSDFTTTGYNIPAKDIDSYGKLKTDPNSQLGSLLYNTDSNDFDVVSYNAILNPGVEQSFGNVGITYNENSDTFTYKGSGSSTKGEFLQDYIDSLTIINESEFITTIMNQLYGTVTTNQNKTTQQAVFEEKINRTLNKIIDEEDNITISDDELREIEFQSQERVNGTNSLDVGCQVLSTQVSLDDLQDLVDNTKDSSDPFNVGNQYVNTLNNSFDSDQTSSAQENDQAIKDGFFKRLINAIVFALVSSITLPPQIRTLLAIVGAFKNNGLITIGDAVDDLANKRKLINCLSKDAKDTINEFIFNLIKKELISLIIPVSKIILKEKINQYLLILRSLIGFS